MAVEYREKIDVETENQREKRKSLRHGGSEAWRKWGMMNGESRNEK